MTELRSLLSFMDPDDRERAIRRYEMMFDAAGTEGEDDLIYQLGSPVRQVLAVERELREARNRGEMAFADAEVPGEEEETEAAPEYAEEAYEEEYAEEYEEEAYEEEYEEDYGEEELPQFAYEAEDAPEEEPAYEEDQDDGFLVSAVTYEAPEETAYEDEAAYEEELPEDATYEEDEDVLPDGAGWVIPAAAAVDVWPALDVGVDILAEEGISLEQVRDVPISDEWAQEPDFAEAYGAEAASEEDEPPEEPADEAYEEPETSGEDMQPAPEEEAEAASETDDASDYDEDDDDEDYDEDDEDEPGTGRVIVSAVASIPLVLLCILAIALSVALGAAILAAGFAFSACGIYLMGYVFGGVISFMPDTLLTIGLALASLALALLLLWTGIWIAAGGCILAVRFTKRIHRRILHGNAEEEEDEEDAEDAEDEDDE